MRFRDQNIVFAVSATGHSKGQNFEIPTADPTNYFHVISNSADLPKLTIDGKLFLPALDHRKAQRKAPACYGGAGQPRRRALAPRTCRDVVGDGFAAFVLDSFGARDVTSTVANQTQFSFAASAYDVLAAWQVLAAHPEIDASGSARSHSRGGSAVLTAATRRFAMRWSAPAFSQRARRLSLERPPVPRSLVDETEIRVIMGDADEWCSPMQVQGHCQAIRLSGGRRRCG